jgi:hypothetical protein
MTPGGERRSFPSAAAARVCDVDRSDWVSLAFSIFPAKGPFL